MSELKFEPDYAVHPKETIKEFVDYYPKLAKRLVIQRTLLGDTYSFREAEEIADLMIDGDGNNYLSAQFLIDLQTNYLSKIAELNTRKPDEAKWISVEETPPENGKRYIICGGVGYCLNGVWHTMMDINHPAIQWPVTQYMELLYHEPPKQSEGSESEERPECSDCINRDGCPVNRRQNLSESCPYYDCHLPV